jgi:uncharacterized protein YjiS (DUF1127 family)
METTMARAALPPLAAFRSVAIELQGALWKGFLALELALQVRNERRALRELGDAGLKDIGLTRSDVDAEGARSFWDLPIDRLR